MESLTLRVFCKEGLHVNCKRPQVLTDQNLNTRGLNRFVHEGMKDISNVKVHLKTRKGNVKI